MKRVLLLVVDGCTSRLLGPALEDGELPVLQALRERGRLSLNCVSIFPSITPAATASIATGRYPAAHGITGMSWWNPETGTVSYFGDDVWTVFKRGAGDFLEGFLLRLNGDRLRAPTMFETAERQGLRTASFNHLIFRGNVPHRVSQPTLLRLLPSVGSTLTVYGPTWLCLGDFVSNTGKEHDLSAPGGAFNRFGLDDEGTAGLLRDLPSARALPEFSVAYFADYDFVSHEQGPRRALATLRRFDERLGQVFDRWGGLDRVLEDACVLLTADHSHSDVSDEADAAIALEELLDGFKCAQPGDVWQRGDDVMICPNMRAAELYLRHSATEPFHAVQEPLLRDRRIDHVVWRELGAGADEFHVATRERGSLRFSRARNGLKPVSDEYGGLWEIEGDLQALDMAIESGRISYGVYPNALERIALGVDDRWTRRLWVTARPGYEFQVPGQDVHHGGGSHGTLHELDSLVPLLVAGDPDDRPLPPTPRIVDAAPLAAAVLGISADVAPWQSHG